MERCIVHMDLDTFFVSVERLRNSELMGRPVIIGGNAERGVVASCSYEARRYGVHSGMAMKMAKRLCPDALVLRGDLEAYSHHSRIITEIVAESVPLYEKASIDEFYFDLTGMDRFFGCERYAAELRQKIIRESGLPLSMGISTNKTVSKVATGEAKPNGKQRVWQGLEKPFLSPLPVRKIPMIGAETAKTLQQLGIQRIGTLQQIAPERLQTVFGKNGIDLWQRANGIDERAVEPYREEKSISHEHTFDQDTIDHSELTGRLVRMAESLGKQLRELGKMGSTLTVKIRYADFNTHSKQMRIPLTASDEALMAHAKRLLEQVWERRQRIRLVGLRVSGLVTGSPQLDLFDGISGGNESKKMKLYAAMDQIKNKYGKTAVGRAAGQKPHD